MRIPQLSISVANKPGHLVAPCQLLAEAGINLVTLSLAERQEYGILRLIVRDWQRAKEVLGANGFRVTVTEVLAVQVERRDDRLVPGPVHRPDVEDRLPLLPPEPEPVLEDEHLHRPIRAHVPSPASALRTRAMRAAASPHANRKYRYQDIE